MKFPLHSLMMWNSYRFNWDATWKIVVEMVPFLPGHVFTPEGHFLNPTILPIRSSQLLRVGKTLEMCFSFQCHLFSKWPGMRHFARLSSIGIHLLHVWMGDLFHCQRLAGPTKTHFFWKFMETCLLLRWFHLAYFVSDFLRNSMQFQKSYGPKSFYRRGMDLLSEVRGQLRFDSFQHFHTCDHLVSREYVKEPQWSAVPVVLQ